MRCILRFLQLLDCKYCIYHKEKKSNVEQIIKLEPLTGAQKWKLRWYDAASRKNLERDLIDEMPCIAQGGAMIQDIRNCKTT
jgi:hypothetical protein